MNTSLSMIQVMVNRGGQSSVNQCNLTTIKLLNKTSQDPNKLVERKTIINARV